MTKAKHILPIIAYPFSQFFFIIFSWFSNINLYIWIFISNRFIFCSWKKCMRRIDFYTYDDGRFEDTIIHGYKETLSAISNEDFGDVKTTQMSLLTTELFSIIYDLL